MLSSVVRGMRPRYTSFLDQSEDVVIATWRENSANTVWRVVARFPLRQVSVVCWKACFVIHRVFRDGPKQVQPAGGLKPLYLSKLPCMLCSVKVDACLLGYACDHFDGKSSTNLFVLLPLLILKV